MRFFRRKIPILYISVEDPLGIDGLLIFAPKYFDMKHFRKERDALRAEFVFGDFAEAFAFMTRVAFVAERLGHHPNWENVWNRVGISLTTHDAGNKVTDKDEALAEAIEEIFERSAR